MSELDPSHRFRIIPQPEEMHHWHLGRPVAHASPAPSTLALASVVFTAAFVGSLYLAPQSVLAAQTQPLIQQGRASVDAALGYAAQAERVLAAGAHFVVLPRLSIDTRTLGARLEVAQAAAADTSGSFAGYLAALWDQFVHGNEVTATNTEPASLYVAPTTRITSSTIPRTSVASVAPVRTIITQPVIERVVTQSAPITSGVSASLLASSLQSLRDDLLNRIAGISIPAPAVPSVPIQAFAASQRIDALSGTTLTNVIVKGVSGLTAGDIPALAYLATSGGTISGDLTIQGALSAAALAVSSISSSGAIEAPYFTATSTTASTFPNLLATNGTTTNATSTNLYAASLVAGSATSTNLFSTLGHFTTGIIDTLTATVATITSLTASNLTATNATTTSATTTNLAITGTGTSMLLSTDSTGRVIATSTPAAASFIATSSTASQFPYASSTAITVSGTASSSKLIASTSFTLANLTGLLKATAGAVATSLVNLASDVTGILPVANGGTGWAAITAGTIPYGNGTGAVATSSALTFDGTKLIATYASTTAITSSGSAYFATVGGNVGVGTISPGAKLEVDSGAGDANSLGLALFLNPSASTAGRMTDIEIGKSQASGGAAEFGYSSDTGTPANSFAYISNWGDSQSTASLVVKKGGNVGIGTTTPRANLDINAPGGGATISLDSAGLSNGTIFASGGAGADIAVMGSRFTVLETGSNVLALEAYNGGISIGTTPQNYSIPTNGLLVAGIVGIGTASPNSTVPLTLRNTNASAGKLWTVGPDTNNNYLVYSQGGTGVWIGDGQTAWNANSDQRLKTNIVSLASSTLSQILSLNPVTYNWKNTKAATTTQIGFIAQEVQPIFPELVSHGPDAIITNPDGSTTTIASPLGLNYTGFIPPIVKAIQELAANLSSIASRVSAIEATVAGFANSVTTHQLNADELCLKSTCLTQAQLQALLAGSQAPPPASTQIRSVDPSTTTPPTIIIEGDNPATIHVGDPYADIGAIAKDSLGHDLSFRTFLNGVLASSIVVDTSATATDTIDYVATDTWGNTSTSTRTVIVEAAATASPATEPSTSTSTPPATLISQTATSTATTSPSGQ